MHDKNHSYDISLGIVYTCHYYTCHYSIVIIMYTPVIITWSEHFRIYMDNRLVGQG